MLIAYYEQGIMPWNNGFYGYYIGFKDLQNTKQIRHRDVISMQASLHALSCTPYWVTYSESKWEIRERSIWAVVMQRAKAWRWERTESTQEWDIHWLNGVESSCSRSRRPGSKGKLGYVMEHVQWLPEKHGPLCKPKRLLEISEQNHGPAKRRERRRLEERGECRRREENAGGDRNNLSMAWELASFSRPSWTLITFLDLYSILLPMCPSLSSPVLLLGRSPFERPELPSLMFLFDARKNWGDWLHASSLLQRSLSLVVCIREPSPLWDGHYSVPYVCA